MLLHGWVRHLVGTFVMCVLECCIRWLVKQYAALPAGTRSFTGDQVMGVKIVMNTLQHPWNHSKNVFQKFTVWFGTYFTC